MTDSPAPIYPLLPYPGASRGAVRRLDVRIEMAADRTLRLDYVLETDLQHVRIPPAVRGGGRAERLWMHTCFEAFVAGDDSPGYLELNFSPSGQWAAYCFESYRQGMAAAELAADPHLQVRQSARELELQATVRVASRERIRLGLSAVVEDDEGGLSYWALRHPPGRPDFHHPDSFSLALEPSPSP